MTPNPPSILKRLGIAVQRAVGFIMFYGVMSTAAHATLLDKFVQGFANIFSSAFVTAAAFIAICVISVFFMLGRLEFARAAIVALGIAMIIGAANVVTYIQSNAAI